MDTFLGFLSVLLAAGVGLDAIARKSTKTSLAHWLTRSTSSIASASFNPTHWSDRLFGSRLVSWRALGCSGILTLVSLFVSFAVAYFTTAGLGRLDIISFLTFSSVLSPLPSLSIILLSVFIADFLSYAQTRVFLKSISQNQTATVTAVFLFADLVASLFIYLLVFSVGRTIVYGIVIATMMPTMSTLDLGSAPAPIARAISTLDLTQAIMREDASWSDNNRIMLVRSQLALADARTPTRVRKYSAQRSAADLPGTAQTRRFVRYTTREECLQSQSAIIVENMDVYVAYQWALTDLREALRALPTQVRGGVSDDALQRSLRSAFVEDLARGDGECRLLLLRTTATIDARSMLSTISLGDLYLASFRLSLSELLDSIGSKLATFHATDLAAESPRFLAEAWASRSYSLLGLAGDRRDDWFMSEYMRVRARPPENIHVVVPSSILAGSSLSASVFLWLFVAAATIATLASTLARGFGRLFAGMKLATFPFTAIALSTILVLVAISAVGTLLQGVWRALVGAI